MQADKSRKSILSQRNIPVKEYFFIRIINFSLAVILPDHLTQDREIVTESQATVESNFKGFPSYDVCKPQIDFSHC